MCSIGNRTNDEVYEQYYRSEGKFFGEKPAPVVQQIPDYLPPSSKINVLEIACGEGRNAVYLASLGYSVTAIDISTTGIEKTRAWAREAKVKVDARIGDLKTYVPAKKYDVIFSTWSLQFLPVRMHRKVIHQYQVCTKKNGINAFSVFVKKPWLEIPHHERNCTPWYSGEVLSYYRDWKIEYCDEEVFDCECGGTPHAHAGNTVIARKM